MVDKNIEETLIDNTHPTTHIDHTSRTHIDNTHPQHTSTTHIRPHTSTTHIHNTHRPHSPCNVRVCCNDAKRSFSSSRAASNVAAKVWTSCSRSSNVFRSWFVVLSSKLTRSTKASCFTAHSSSFAASACNIRNKTTLVILPSNVKRDQNMHQFNTYQFNTPSDPSIFVVVSGGGRKCSE